MTTLLSAKDVASLLGISLRKLEQMIERGELPAYARLGRIRKWRNADIQLWLDSVFDKPKQQGKEAASHPANTGC